MPRLIERTYEIHYLHSLKNYLKTIKRKTKVVTAEIFYIIDNWKRCEVK